MRSLSPVVGIPACAFPVDTLPFHGAGDKYVRAVREYTLSLPLIIPAIGPQLDLDDLLRHLDGLLITGSESNVEPRHYNGPPSAPGTLHDPERDATTLPLLRKAIAAGVPVLAICRGHQELNVALGGTLHQVVHNVPGFFKHSPDETLPIEEQFEVAHSVRLTSGGMLRSLMQTETIMVNSLHDQGIDSLAPDLIVEATAEDGMIEAVRVKEAPSFALGVQWHPEWLCSEASASIPIFRAFGAAVSRRSRR
ncbi:putative glutamine amidotransferase [Azospirillaceae bacterium]